MAGITKEQVFDAANIVLEAMENPIPQKVTLARVRQHLGTGSMTTITKHLRAWKEDQEDHNRMPADIAAAASTFLNGIYRSACSAAQVDMQAERDELFAAIEEREAAAEQIEDQNKNLKVDIAAARESLRDIVSQNELLTGEANRLTSMIDNRDELLSRAEAENKEISDRNLQLERKNAALSAKLETAGQTEIAELRVQLAEMKSRAIHAEAKVRGFEQQLEDENTG